jgi:hypothetical protein
MDYRKITADSVRGPEIGRLYMDASPFVTRLAKIAYLGFAVQVERQFNTLTSPSGYGIRVEFQDEDPYPSAEAMMDDVRNHARLKVYRTAPDQRHPLLPDHVNNMFRAVHDFHGHYMTGRDFSRHGEEAAWVRHSRMFTGLARRAMTSETRGQNSAFIWINDGREFPPQKAVLLPDWVSEIPERWAS